MLSLELDTKEKKTINQLMLLKVLVLHPLVPNRGNQKMMPQEGEEEGAGHENTIKTIQGNGGNGTIP